MKTGILRNYKHRVRGSVYPTNRIILTERGVRQVPFPYIYYTYMKFINLSVRQIDFDELKNEKRGGR